MFAYHNHRMPDSPEEGKAMMEKWKQWLVDMGEAMIEPGNPLGMSKTVSAEGVEDNGGPNPLSGYSVVAAEDMDAALAMAKKCPHLSIGTIEIAELKSMPG